MSVDWANKAIANACITRPFAELIDTINKNIQVKIKADGYSKFSDLTQADQAALIEREFFEVSDNCDIAMMLSDYDFFLLLGLKYIYTYLLILFCRCSRRKVKY